MDFMINGKKKSNCNRTKILAWVLLFSFSYFQLFPAYAEDPFTLVSGGFTNYTCDTAGCTFNGLQNGTILQWNNFNIDLGNSLSFLFSTAGGSV